MRVNLITLILEKILLWNHGPEKQLQDEEHHSVHTKNEGKGGKGETIEAILELETNDAPISKKKYPLYLFVGDSSTAYSLTAGAIAIKTPLHCSTLPLGTHPLHHPNCNF